MRKEREREANIFIIVPVQVLDEGTDKGREEGGWQREGTRIERGKKSCGFPKKKKKGKRDESRSGTLAYLK